MHDVLAHAAALLLLVAALVLPGHALERCWLRGADLDGLRVLARIALGIAAWMLALFACAALGLLRPLPLALLLAGFAAAAALAQRRFGSARGEPWDAAFLAAAFLLTAPFWLLPLGYQVLGDAATYHLALPKLYLAAGGFREVPLSVYAIWPHATELLFALAMLARDHALAGALHGAFGVLALHAVHAACRAQGRSAAGWLAAPLALANPVLAFELGIAYVDLAFAFFLAAGVVFMQRALRSQPADPGALALAGACGGALAGIKLNGALGAAAIAALALPRALALARAGELQSLARLALCFALPLGALGLPWVLRSAWLTGNPIYPFFYAQLGGPDWSAALGERFAAWQRGIGMGRSAFDYALLPVRVLALGGADYTRFAGRLGPHWLPLLPLALVLGWRQPLARAALAASAVYFACWAAGSQQMRFLIPVLPLWALACALALDDGAARLAAQRPARLRALRGALGAAAVAVLLLATRAHHAAALAALPGLRVDASARQAAAVDPAFDWANAALPVDARVLLLDTNQSFFLEREALADSFFEASQIADWLAGAGDPAEAHARLRARGISHVLRDRRRDWGIAWPPALLALLGDPELAPRRYRSPDGRVEVWELRR